ncbi:MAG: SDR family NAD(P)-dependent oxidoreductase [Opitutales bacterium]
MPISERSKTLSKAFNRFSVIIVTGGSSGIGCSLIKAIRKLTQAPLLCNLSRSKPEVFLGKNGQHLSTDLSSPESLEASALELRKRIREAGAGAILLINNSGFGDYGPFQQSEAEKQLNMIDLNIRAVVDLTARLMPDLEERGGVVMNIASTAAFQPTPFLATYGATKAFVLNWTLALNEDLRDSPARAMAVCPGPTRSNFFRRAGFEVPPMQGGGINGSLDMTSDEVAWLALAGLAKGRALVVTGWKNKCIAFWGGILPRRLVTRVGGLILRKLRLGADSQKESSN